MAKDNRKDIYPIRLGSEDKKEEIQKRCKQLKDSKGYTQVEIFEAGLLALEGGNDEQQIIYKKNKTIAERDKALIKVKDSNLRIEAYNRQLKNKNSSRYKDLKIDEDVIKIYDEKGNEI